MSRLQKLLSIAVIVLSVIVVGIASMFAFAAISDATDGEKSSINQIYNERIDNTNPSIENNLRTFINEKMIIPCTQDFIYTDTIYGNTEIKLLINKNVVDKFVTVQNTGEADVILRTFFAIESGDADVFLNVNTNGWKWFNLNNGNNPLPVQADVLIQNKKYDIYCAEYTEVLSKDEITSPSLLQVALDKNTTSEQAASFGEELEIMVYSEAVPKSVLTDVLDFAMGNPQSYHPWGKMNNMVENTYVTVDETE